MRARPERLLVLVPAEREHADLLAPRLRGIDRIECEAMGRTGHDALRHGVLASAESWTALVDGEPQAMFGVVVESVAGSLGIPWFLGSEQVSAHGRTLVAMGPALVGAMHRHGRTLRNFVSSDNRPAIRLLEHWGFDVEHEVVRMRGVAFRPFKREIS